MKNNNPGQVIRFLRKSKGITATHMANSLGYKAVSSYMRLETGESTITLEKAKIIADILQVDINYFFDKKLRITRNFHSA